MTPESSELRHFIEQDVYGLDKATKQAFFTPHFKQLTQFHQAQCSEYQSITQAFAEIYSNQDMQTTLPLSVRLFKTHTLSSTDRVFKELNSSGTSGHPSRIFLDTDSAKLQSKVLVKILQQWIGKQRLPLLLIDSPTTLQKSTGMTARAAGLQGLSFLGYDHTYALNEDMQLNLPVVEAFFEKYQNTHTLMFGFTFMVWQHFLAQLKLHQRTFTLSKATLLHGGGWKKLQQSAVSKRELSATAQQYLGNVAVHDYYGMVEQTGTIYVECEHGHLHCPVWSDVLIRDPADMRLCQPHEKGLIQVNSLLARSYPGHCLLTDDIGTLLGEDDCACGRRGKYFIVHGRVPAAEVRGCSDTFA